MESLQQPEAFACHESSNAIALHFVRKSDFLQFGFFLVFFLASC
jgi:hypothetical protein